MPKIVDDLETTVETTTTAVDALVTLDVGATAEEMDAIAALQAEVEIVKAKLAVEFSDAVIAANTWALNHR